MLKKLVVLSLVSILSLTLWACAGQTEAPATEAPETEAETETPEAEAPEAEEPEAETATEEAGWEGLTVNEAEKEVSFEAVFNGIYVTEPTRHAIVWEQGGNAEKSMFRAKAYNVDFHDALSSLGLSGDSNVSMDDMKSTPEDNVVNTGDALAYFIKWEGQDEIPFEDVIIANSDFDWNVVFAGNKDVAVSTQAGCFLCFDSCAAGVTVNTLPVGSTAEGGIQFSANGDLLPDDGTTVTIIVRPGQ